MQDTNAGQRAMTVDASTEVILELTGNSKPRFRLLSRAAGLIEAMESRIATARARANRTNNSFAGDA